MLVEVSKLLDLSEFDVLDENASLLLQDVSKLLKLHELEFWESTC